MARSSTEPSEAPNEGAPPSSSLSYDGTGDIRVFFFKFEETVAATQTDTERAVSLLRYLHGPALSYYCDRFCTDTFTKKEEAKSYAVVKQVLSHKFAPPTEALGAHYLRALAYRYDGGDIEKFLCETELLYAKAQLS